MTFAQQVALAWAQAHAANQHDPQVFARRVALVESITTRPGLMDRLSAAMHFATQRQAIHDAINRG